MAKDIELVFLTFSYFLCSVSYVHALSVLTIGNGSSSSCSYAALANGIESKYSSSITKFNITFDCGSLPVTISFTDHIWLYGTVQIDGDGTITFDGGGVYRIFVIGQPVTSAYVGRPSGYHKITLRNLVIANGGGSPTIIVMGASSASTWAVNETVGKRDGGCIHVTNAASIYLYDSVFKNCTTVGDYVPDPQVIDNDVTFLGGAIYMNNYAQMTATNVSFLNNVAGQEGGAIYARIRSGNKPISFILYRCVFDGNRALGPFIVNDPRQGYRGGGGAIFTYNSLYISKSVFRNNVALYGGAIRIQRADLFIDGCLFENNTAVNISSSINSTSYGRGGAIYVEDSDGDCNIGRNSITLTNTVLRGNTSPLPGGTLHMILYPIRQYVTLENITVCNNGGAGGGMDVAILCYASQSVNFRSIFALNSSIYVSPRCTQVTWDVRPPDGQCLELTPYYGDVLPVEYYTFPVIGTGMYCPQPIPSTTTDSFSTTSSIQSTAMFTSTAQQHTSSTSNESLLNSAMPSTESTSIESPSISITLSTESTSKESSLISTKPSTKYTETTLRNNETTNENSMNGYFEGASECKSFWNDREPKLAVDSNLSSCYESGYETNSWWMTRLHSETKHISQVILSGEIHGQTQIRVGVNYSPFDPPHYQTDTNKLCASLPLYGSVHDLVITCSTNLHGKYLSITVIGKSVHKISLCDVRVE